MYSTNNFYLFLEVGTVVIPLILLLLIVLVLGGIAYYLHRRRLLWFKHKELGGTSVSFHGNVVSFTNPNAQMKMVNCSFSLSFL